MTLVLVEILLETDYLTFLVMENTYVYELFKKVCGKILVCVDFGAGQSQSYLKMAAIMVFNSDYKGQPVVFLLFFY